MLKSSFVKQKFDLSKRRAYRSSSGNGIWCFHLEVAIDKQGRIVIPKEIREKYGLSEDGKLELVAREDVIELIPLTKEDDLAIRALKDPCKTGNSETRDKVFSREDAWKR